MPVVVPRRQSLVTAAIEKLSGRPVLHAYGTDRSFRMWPQSRHVNQLLPSQVHELTPETCRDCRLVQMDFGVVKLQEAE